MADMKLYEYRRHNGLCVRCGEKAENGKSRCLYCLQIEAVKQKMRSEKWSDEKRKEKAEYLKQWQKRNPEKMKTYKSRKSEYNRRYFYEDEG